MRTFGIPKIDSGRYDGSRHKSRELWSSSGTLFLIILNRSVKDSRKFAISLLRNQRLRVWISYQIISYVCFRVYTKRSRIHKKLPVARRNLNQRERKLWTTSRKQSEVGGGTGAKRSPLPGIQAQRPSPSHRTHDTTDQWRELVGG